MRKLVTGLVLLAVVLSLLWVVGRPAYRRHKEHRAVAQAEQFLAQGEHRKASLSARQAVQLNPRNLEACRIMARLAEISGVPQALDWSKQVVAISPTIENRLALARVALRFEPPPLTLATQTLRELDPDATNLAGFYVLSAELALKLKRAAEAESHFETALRLEPTNQLHQMNLAVLQLASTNVAIAAEARFKLDRLRSDPGVAPAVLRWLITDCLRRADVSGAKRYSSELLLTSHSQFSDRLQHLEILQSSTETEFQRFLADLQTDVSTNSARIYALSSWLIRHRLPEPALQWLTSLPPEIQQQQPIRLSRADCYIARKDWHSLQDFIQDQQWNELDFMRLALLSRAAFEQQDQHTASTRWRLAVHAAGQDLSRLGSLLAMAEACGRSESREELLWKIIRQRPHEPRFYCDLDGIYVKSGDTRGLNKLYTFLASVDATNFVARNNAVATSLLLKTNLSEAHQLAKDLFRAHTNDAVIASTYAYSLHLQGKTDEGLAVLRPFSAQIAEHKALALYYGLLLSQERSEPRAGDPSGVTSARPRGSFYLTLASEARLLPEERELLEAALKSL